ncbi:hypothetical protein [Sphingorhabdus sp.]|uniref:hypothetical protein n=1 Tax=Sphingorhabdus sp. TaxID=1902408 RepID=UPI003593DDF1
MPFIMRIVVGLIGIMALLGVNPHWFKLDDLASERGIEAISAIGRANVRADVGGLFLAIAIFALLAAAKQSRTWLLAVTLLVGSALLGRVVSVAIDGYVAAVGPPMATETAIIAILILAYWSWGKKPEGL